METIQIVLDKKLLHATDQAARRTQPNRSALVRDALREHLRTLEGRAKEERDRKPHAPNESLRLGCGGGMASRIARGDVRPYKIAPPDSFSLGWRSQLILTEHDFAKAKERCLGTRENVFGDGRKTR